MDEVQVEGFDGLPDQWNKMGPEDIVFCSYIQLLLPRFV